MKLTVKAYAKINLFLDITGRRPDGYHTITGVMQAISLHDEVTVEVTEGNNSGITLTCSDPTLPTGEKNLGWRAARAFLDETGLALAINIHIEKHIPAAAGMAGGSTDAAAVLRTLNDLCDSPLTEDGLRRVGLSLGADVPFCLAGGTHLTEGVGEVLTPVAPLPDCDVVVACAGEGVSTPAAYKSLDEMYGHFDGSVYTPRYTRLDALCTALTDADLNGVAHNAYNIFESAVLPVRPVAQSIRDTLQSHGACLAMMSGSGPSVFGLFREGDTEAALDALERAGIPAWLCHPQNI